MFFAHLRELIGMKAVRQSDQSWPKPTMNKGYFAHHEATNQDVG